MESVPEKRYLSNIVGFIFIALPLIITIFIEEKLKRHEKDAEIVIHHYKKEDHEYDLKKKKVSSSQISLK